ncbi:MAG: GNAT family N-acetyltransferase [Bacteroidetes bacterium]|nr:MAG: GNAT family N-acetyltransferase [Bacteroidota bacterium]
MITQIRLANSQDIEALANISSKTFFETYAAFNTAENMNQHLLEKYNHNQISKEINDSKNSFLLAFFFDTLVGYVKLTENTKPELTNKKALEVERIYVLKTYQKRKIGEQLMQKCLEIAQEKAFDVIWLGVWERNPKAIEFYNKQGFEMFGQHIFWLGKDAQFDWLMKKDLKN